MKKFGGKTVKEIIDDDMYDDDFEDYDFADGAEGDVSRRQTNSRTLTLTSFLCGRQGKFGDTFHESDVNSCLSES